MKRFLILRTNSNLILNLIYLIRSKEENHWVKASVSLVDLGALIMRKVFQQKQSSCYFYLGLFFAILNALLPSVNRLYRGYKKVIINHLTKLFKLHSLPLKNFKFIPNNLSVLNHQTAPKCKKFYE